MSRFACALCAIVATTSVGVCMAQKAVSFKSTPFPGGVRPGDIYTTDVNQDGMPDILQDHAVKSGWSEILATVPGQFGSPMAIGAGQEINPQLAIALGDFNHDNRPDFAAPVYDVTPAIETKLNTGGGSFSTSFSNFGVVTNRFIAVADLNGDGNPDLIVQSGDALYAVLRNGGTFGTNTPIYPILSGTEVRNVVVGDFNGDGHADVAFVDATPCGTTFCAGVLHVMFGDGNLGFDDTTPYEAQGSLSIAAGDLNSDGITDLFGVDENLGELAVFYGSPGKVFASYFPKVPAGKFGGTSGGFSPPLVMADFNADWKMDIVGVEHDANTGTDNLVFFLSAGQPGAFTTQIVPLPKHLYTTNPIVEDFNRDRKPDVIVNQSDGAGSTMLVLLNTTNTGVWSDCPYPPSGINACSPNQTSASPVAFSAAATSFGNVRKMEVWVDGSKLVEQNFTWGSHGWLHTSAALTTGPHAVQITSSNIDNQTQTTSFSLAVGPPVCPPPASAGVNVCTPTGGTTVGQPIAVHASATVSGTFQLIDVWLDGVKLYTQKTTPYLDASIPALPGPHKLSIIAHNTAGGKWQATVNVTAQ